MALLISRARTAIVSLVCWLSSISQTWDSGMGMSKKFRVCCKIVVLLTDRFFVVGTRCRTLEKSIDDSACVKQVSEGTQIGFLLWGGERVLLERIKVGPLDRHE